MQGNLAARFDAPSHNPEFAYPIAGSMIVGAHQHVGQPL